MFLDDGHVSNITAESKQLNDADLGNVISSEDVDGSSTKLSKEDQADIEKIEKNIASKRYKSSKNDEQNEISDERTNVTGDTKLGAQTQTYKSSDTKSYKKMKGPQSTFQDNFKFGVYMRNINHMNFTYVVKFILFLIYLKSVKILHLHIDLIF